MKLPVYRHQESPLVDAQIPRLSITGAGALGRTIAGAGEQFGDLTAQLVKAEEVLQKQQADLELATTAGQYDAGIEAIKTNLAQDPAYLTHEAKFTRQATALQEGLTQRMTSPLAQEAFRAHTARTLPKSIVTVRANALKLFGQGQVGQLDALEEDLSKQAAEATTDIDRDEKIATHASLVRRAGERGFLKPGEEQTRIASFREKQLVKQMDVLGRSDPSQLYELERTGAFADVDPLKRQKILEGVRQRQEQTEQRQEKVFKTAREAVEWNWSSLANQGKLLDAEIERALRGEDPFISPEKARQYKQVNEMPPTGEGNLQVRVLMQEYHGGKITRARIEKTRQQLNQLARDLGRPNVLLNQALNELQTDETTERTTQAAEISAGIKLAEDDFKSNFPIVMLGKLGQMQKNQQAADLAEIRNKIRRGQKPDKTVQDILKRRQLQKEAVPDKANRVFDLLD